MLFGEIVEPSTRALIDDECEDFPDYTKTLQKWQSGTSCAPAPPEDLNTLIFIDSAKIIKLFENLVFHPTSDPQIHLMENGTIRIHKLTTATLQLNIYIVVYSEKDLTVGEAVEALADWIKEAKNIYAITSMPIATYLNGTLSDNRPDSLIRLLSSTTTTSEDDPQTNTAAFGLRRLEPPNLVSGFGADVLSYCRHINKSCTLFVTYTDTTPWDSMNSQELIRILKLLKVDIIKSAVHLNVTSINSNLYM